MFRHLKYVKSLQRPPMRVLHIKSPLQSSSSLKGIVSSVKSNVELQREVPYIIDGQNYRYKEGSIYHGFLCERIEPIADYGLMSCTLRHLGTGTEFWHLDSRDIQNVFSIHFRTKPLDSSGLPHVLEHLVLCGSKNWPVRDLFFKMIIRSVATFTNAMTGPDYTMYHFSSKNEIDFRNMQQVYLDAVFRPNLLYMDFLQEGWRLEHKNIHDQNSDIVIKGVVYNEMIGSFGDNSRFFKQKMLNYLLPNNSYGHIATGTQLEIPNVEHEDLIKYHRKYYHPSNARIFSYGSFDMKKTLEFIDKEYLSHYDRIDTSFSSTPSEDRWSKPHYASIQGRPDSSINLDHQNRVGIAMLMCDVTDIQENFELKVLSELLFRGPNSPFHKSMIEPNFSGGYTKWTGYLPTCRDTYFNVGLQDVADDDVELFEVLFDDTVYKASREGFDSKHVEAILSALELLRKQQSEYKRLLYKSTVLWNHDGDVVSNLRISDMFETLRDRLKNNPKYFEQKIEKYFINNKHKLTITMRPNKFHEIERQQAEAKLILRKLEETSDQDFEKIYENGLKLEAFQKAPQNIEVLPCLSINDVQKPFPRPQINELTLRGVSTMINHEPIAGITYLKCMFNTTGLSLNDAILLPLFCRVFSEMGSSNHDHRQFDNLLLSKMARVECTAKIVENVTDCKTYRLGLLMKTYALDKNVCDMFRICEDLLLNFQFEDTELLKVLIRNYISKLKLEVKKTGDLHAMLCSSALVTNAAQLKSLLSGVDHIHYMKKYVKENSIEAIRDSLKSIGSKVFSRSNLRVAINTSENNVFNVLGDYERFLTHLPTIKQTADSKEIFLLEPSFRYHNIDMPISFCAKTFFAVPYAHEDHPALRVLAKFLTSKYLWPVVREKNGAYGAGARIGFDGLFNVHSYRDPNAAKTMDIFDKTYEWLQTHWDKLDEQSLFEAKLAALQLVDWPISAGEVGLDSFVLGATYDIYLQYRSRVLAVTLDDVQNIIEKYYRNEPKHFGKCILGPKSKVIEVKEMFKDVNVKV
ncbi:presequence protease, mitochondrial-like isoform X1 [Drosophila nasuta]|uniref:presequence protease, mitochondrial-like isoform X1 n=2 Tax=Drosophila nasuta TaxID=42062 RepID=UPI00295E7AE5|nr:presequence protease, mitochondrial-like isoform X1 [Drosophila nasuta]